MIVPNRAPLEALDGGQSLVQALDEIISRVTTIPFAIGTARIHSGTGSPENRIKGSIGDLYLRTDGSTSTTFYVKESGKETKLGWIAK